jgi:hypothetical protein
VGDALLLRIDDGERDDLAAWKAGGPVSFRPEIGVDLTFHPSHDRTTERCGIGRDAALEALRVEHLEQCRIRTFETVVRRGRQEETMLHVRC